jgi:hypothetical protein
VKIIVSGNNNQRIFSVNNGDLVVTPENKTWRNEDRDYILQT